MECMPLASKAVESVSMLSKTQLSNLDDEERKQLARPITELTKFVEAGFREYKALYNRKSKLPTAQV